ncbi:MAG TPA: glycosyltransferase, partial [Rhodocyclaceae bacterium]|nr:glycosyltransferase [Rhodocyclaceae bacterium]
MEQTSGKLPRVCFATIEYPPDWGGVSKSAQRIVKMLVEGGFEVHVFVPTDTQEEGAGEIEPIAVDGISLYRIPTSRDFSPSSVLSFFKAIDQANKALSFDIFHGFYLPMAHPCLPVAAKAKRPVIASIRGDDGVVLLRGDTASAMSKILREAAWITSVSGDSLLRANALVNISRKSSFIPNSIRAGDGPQWQMT